MPAYKCIAEQAEIFVFLAVTQDNRAAFQKIPREAFGFLGGFFFTGVVATQFRAVYPVDAHGYLFAKQGIPAGQIDLEGIPVVHGRKRDFVKVLQGHGGILRLGGRKRKY